MPQRPAALRVSLPAWRVWLIALSLPLMALVARADEGRAPGGPMADTPSVWLNIGGFSRHFNREARYNERNFGVGLEWRHSPEVALMAGVYDNSLRKPSQYAAVNWQPWQIGPIKLGAAIGVLNGYPAIERGGTFFAALPMATLEGRRFGVNLGVIPSMKNVDGALLPQFKLRIR